MRTVICALLAAACLVVLACAADGVQSSKEADENQSKADDATTTSTKAAEPSEEKPVVGASQGPVQEGEVGQSNNSSSGTTVDNVQNGSADGSRNLQGNDSQGQGKVSGGSSQTETTPAELSSGIEATLSTLNVDVRTSNGGHGETDSIVGASAADSPSGPTGLKDRKDSSSSHSEISATTLNSATVSGVQQKTVSPGQPPDPAMPIVSTLGKNAVAIPVDGQNHNEEHGNENPLNPINNGAATKDDVDNSIGASPLTDAKHYTTPSPAPTERTKQLYRGTQFKEFSTHSTTTGDNTKTPQSSTGSESKVDSTTTTQITEDITSPADPKKIPTAPNLTLPFMPSHALPLPASVDKTDVSLGSSSLFALAALATLAVAAAAPAH